MNPDLMEDHIIFKKSLRSFFEKECPKSLVKEWEKDGTGFSLELWEKLCHMGCLGLTFPEKYGGAGADSVYLALFYEEVGRALFPSPHLVTEVLAGTAILLLGSEEQKNSILPKITKGNLIVSSSLLDFMPGQYMSTIGRPLSVNKRPLSAARSPWYFSLRRTMDYGQRTLNGYVLNGTKLFVPYGHIAHCFLFTTDKNGSKKQKGTMFFLVKPGQKGMTLRPLKTLSGIKQNEVKLKNLELSEENVLGKADRKVLKKIMDKGVLAISSEMLGGAQAVLDMAVSYAKDRIQFGRPIGSFQANAFKLADLSMAIEGARLLIYNAAWMMSKDMVCDKEISAAKAFMSEVYSQATRDCLQLFGGYGFSEEFDIQLYFRREKELELYMGDGDFHREMVAQAMGI